MISTNNISPQKLYHDTETGSQLLYSHDFQTLSSYLQLQNEKFTIEELKNGREVNIIHLYEALCLQVFYLEYSILSIL